MSHVRTMTQHTTHLGQKLTEHDSNDQDFVRRSYNLSLDHEQMKALLNWSDNAVSQRSDEYWTGVPAELRDALHTLFWSGEK